MAEYTDIPIIPGNGVNSPQGTIDLATSIEQDILKAAHKQYRT